jgi:lipopolysaccharide/colanic/teichoic acid biosynthesis glycosyltransferase
MTLARLAFRKYAEDRASGCLFRELLIRDAVPLAAQNDVPMIDAAAVNLRPDISDPLMVSRLAALLADVDRVIVACRPERRHLWAMLLKGSNANAELLTEDCDRIGAIGINRLGDHATVVVSCAPLDLRNRVFKRLLDLALTGPALILLAPMLVIVGLAIKLDSPGPVFFTQRRFGRGNGLFWIIKFRTMRQELCDADGCRSTQRDDDRTTRLGRFLRKTSIDELPQLFNVLKGEMSLVGPRPHATGSTAGEQLFWHVDQRYWHRHVIKPGMTGLAQIRGYRGATHQPDDLRKRLHADLEYLAGWTIWRDVAILARTVRVMVLGNAF